MSLNTLKRMRGSVMTKGAALQWNANHVQLPHQTWTYIPLENSGINNAEFDGTSGTLTCKRDGLFMFTFSLSANYSGSGSYGTGIAARLVVNGNGMAEEIVRRWGNMTQTQYALSWQGSQVIRLEKGDTVRLQVLQIASGGHTIPLTIGYFNIARLAK